MAPFEYDAEEVDSVGHVDHSIAVDVDVHEALSVAVDRAPAPLRGVSFSSGQGVRVSASITASVLERPEPSPHFSPATCCGTVCRALDCVRGTDPILNVQEAHLRSDRYLFLARTRPVPLGGPRGENTAAPRDGVW